MFTPKKSLGQNFLIDKNIINKIIEIGNINNNKIVLEIGPGHGNLTEAILNKKPKTTLIHARLYSYQNELTCEGDVLSVRVPNNWANPHGFFSK